MPKNNEPGAARGGAGLVCESRELDPHFLVKAGGLERYALLFFGSGMASRR